jgi:hypothetical protein
MGGGPVAGQVRFVLEAVDTLARREHTDLTLMGNSIRLMATLIGVLGLLAACDARDEEEASIAPAEELSATEVLQRVIDAENSITSIREDRTDISTQPGFPAGGESTDPEESRLVRIQVGEDYYDKHEFVGPDFCEGDPDPDCPDFASPREETLWYNGETYYRAGDRWVVEPESGCINTGQFSSCSMAIEHEILGTDSGGFIECPALASAEPVEISQVYSFDFSWLTAPERVADGDESDLVHIKSTIDESFWSFGLPPEIEAAYAECGIDPEEAFGPGDVPPEVSDYFPERFKCQADIWIDPATFYVHRLDFQLDSLNGDRVIATNRIAAAYSLFNEAELPGPLPE